MKLTGHDTFFWRLTTRLTNIESRCYEIKNMDALTPEDWDRIDKKLVELSKDMDEAEIYASNVYQRMIGD